MKDAKFIELLNLYVDHEITTADAALLEAEIERSPERRRVYRQYCRMQKACTVLAQDFAAAAPVADGKIIPFPAHRRIFPAWTYAAAGVAAAACVAFVLIGRSPVTEKSGTAATRNAPPQLVAQGALPAAPQALPKSSVAARPALQAVFAGLVDEMPESEAAMANAGASQLAWMNRVQLSRVPLEELNFEAKPNLRPDVRTYRSRQPLKGQVEMTAFQFQR